MKIKIMVIMLTILGSLIAGCGQAGVEIENVAESGLIDFQQLQPVWQL